MPESVFGLPIHPLVVHATVVLVPLTALVLALAVTLPRFRAWAGWLPVGLAVVSVVLAPVSTSSGERFEEQLGIQSAAVRRHADLGEMLIWWCLAMLVVAVVLLLVHRDGHSLPPRLALALTVVGIVVSLGAVVQVVLIGHSGAEAAWGGVVVTGGGVVATG